MSFFPMWFLLSSALRLIEVLLLVRVVISWVPQWNRSVWGRVVIALTEPILFPLRRVARIPAGPGMSLDISPMIALVILQIVRVLFRL
jgi:YggT family protein